MAFWGASVKPGQKVSVSMSDGGTLLHLSQACLANAKEASPTYVKVVRDGQTLNLACLGKGSQEHCALDLFFALEEPVVFIVEGKNEVHLTGYFEPEDDGADDDDLSDDDDDEEEDDDDDEDDDVDDSDVPQEADLAKNPKGKPAPEKKAAAKKMAKPEEDDDDEDDEDEDDDDDEDEDDDDDEDDEDEDGEDDEEEDDEDEEEEEAPKAGAKRKAAAAAPVNPAKKAKADAQGKGSPKASPKAAPQSPKTSPKTGPAKGGDEEQTYMARVEDYLKKNGTVPVAVVGSKVPKPSALPKLGALLKKHQKKFKCEGGRVSLK